MCLSKEGCGSGTVTTCTVDMSSEYSFVLAGKYGVGKSSIFKRIKTGEVPVGVTEGNSRTTKTWVEEDGGLDFLIFEREIGGEEIRVYADHSTFNFTYKTNL